MASSSESAPGLAARSWSRSSMAARSRRSSVSMMARPHSEASSPRAAATFLMAARVLLRDPHPVDGVLAHGSV